MPLLTLRLSTGSPEPVQRSDGFNNDAGTTVAFDCQVANQNQHIPCCCHELSTVWLRIMDHLPAPHQMSRPVSLKMPPPDTGHQMADRNPQQWSTTTLPACRIDAHIMRDQLRWTGHVVHMNDSCLPKALLYRQLKSGQRPASRPMKWFKDVLKSNLRWCNIDRTTGETATQVRSSWRRTSFLPAFQSLKITASLHCRRNMRAARRTNS